MQMVLTVGERSRQLRRMVMAVRMLAALDGQIELVGVEILVGGAAVLGTCGRNELHIKLVEPYFGITNCAGHSRRICRLQFENQTLNYLKCVLHNRRIFTDYRLRHIRTRLRTSHNWQDRTTVSHRYTGSSTTTTTTAHFPYCTQTQARATPTISTTTTHNHY